MSPDPIELARDIVLGWDTLPSAAPGRIEELRLARALLEREWQLTELREAVEHVVNDSPGTPDSVKKYLARALLARDRQLDELRRVTRANVGDAYNLLTQGESPTQRRGPSAQRIYDRSRAALAAFDHDQDTA